MKPSRAKNALVAEAEDMAEVEAAVDTVAEVEAAVVMVAEVEGAVADMEIAINPV
jgi:hypothetical protein